MLKKVLLAVLLIIAATLSLAACDQLGALGGAAEPEIEISDDGYVVVNGTKTEHKVDTEDKITVSSDGYVVVNGVKTEHKVHTEDEITVDGDGYLVVNGVKTEYAVDYCNHEYETVTTQPTCTAEGYDTTSCKLCGKSTKSNETEKLEHDYSDTYTVAGDYHWFACTACGEVKDKEMHVAGDDNLCTKCKIPLSATTGIVYYLSADGTYAVVTGYNGTDTAVKMADTYKGVPVKEIYSGAFERTSITSVVIPDSVTSVGDCAFYSCDSLTSVVIGDSVTSIGDYAFYNCYSLTSVVIPDSVTSVGSEAFSRCSSLTSVVIGDSVTSIGEFAFYGCNSALYTEYEYGRYVGDGENPYAVLIEVTNKNMSTYTINPATRIIAGSVFNECERLASIEIPDSVTSIGGSAFYDCDSLTSVVIPDSVTSIGNGAFQYCSSFTSVVIPDSVTSIGNFAFFECTSLTSVVIGDSVTSIGSSAFEGCSSLTSVVIGDSVTSIGYRAFYNCDGLTSVVIGDSVTSIGGRAFQCCYSLTSVVIPDSVTSIGSSAFYLCSSLTSIKYRGTEEQWNAIIKGDSWNPYNCTITYNYTGE